MKNRDIVCDCEVIHAEIVEDAKKKMLKDGELIELTDFFKILGDNTRIKLLWALERREMCVCDLAVLLNMTKSAISHQLRSLREANLVKFRREGKVVYYSLGDEHVGHVFDKGLEHIREGKKGKRDENSF